MGLSLKEQGQFADAIQVLSELSGEAPSRWTRLASFRLWAIYLEQNKTQLADEMFTRLATSQSLDELQILIPNAVRQQIVSKYGTRLFDVRNLFQVSRSRVEDVKMIRHVQEFLEVEVEDDLQFELLRAYRLVGQEQEALQLAQNLERVAPTDRVIHHYSWLLRRAGNAPAALELIDRWLIDQSGGYRSDMLPLLVERARVFAALEKWERAEQDLDEYLALTDQQDNTHYQTGLPAAYLLKGFLRERAGDSVAATDAWRRGYVPWKRFLGLYSVAQREKPSAFLHFHILGSLSGQLRYVEAKYFVDKGAESALPASVRPVVTALFLTPELVGKVTSTFQRQYATAHGRPFASRIAFEQLTYAEMFRIAALLPVYQSLVSKSFSEEPSAQEKDIIWKTLEDAYRQTLESNELHDNQVMSLFLAWGTASSFVSNANLTDWMKQHPRIAAGVAYICANRCLSEDKPRVAAELFGKVVDLSRPDSTIRKLAEAKLSVLEKASP